MDRLKGFEVVPTLRHTHELIDFDRNGARNAIHSPTYLAVSRWTRAADFENIEINDMEKSHYVKESNDYKARANERMREKQCGEIEKQARM